MSNHSVSDLLEVFRTHPLRKQTILERVKKQRGSLDGITEQDLAIDSISEVTDQNHVGGFKAVASLGELARISSSSDILDLACGLGGSTRYLAHLYGCRAHGIDISDHRYRDALELTKLVDLESQVTFECGNILEIELPVGKYDVVWGQSSWIHIQEKGTLVHRCYEALRPGGRVALEDACLVREPEDRVESENLRALEKSWFAYLVTMKDWVGLLCESGFEIEVSEEVSEWLLEFCTKQLEIADPDVPEIELQGWSLGEQLVEDGLVGYFRIVARK